jgi:hypothetical protein
MYGPEKETLHRKVVITSHNSKSYQIDGVTFDVTPIAHVFKWKNKYNDNQVEETNMVDYFKKMYNIKISDKEPMLFVNKSDGEKTYLPTSLSHEASLPKDFTQNTRAMKDL